MQHAVHVLPASEHFALNEIAEGVYAAIGIEGSAAYSNAGIIDMGDHTLIFDTFETPKAAEDLRVVAKHLTGRSATHVIISHAHPDHWLGNQVFDGHTTIISTHEVREEICRYADVISEFQKDPSALEEMVRVDELRLKVETDERRRASLEFWIARWHHRLEMLPTLDLRFPNHTFDKKLVLHGTRRTVELRTQGAGHTSSDCFLVLPAEDIAFMGDLAFFQCQPFMEYCDPQAWIAQLKEIQRSDIETFLPGHGPLGSKADIALQEQYITALEELTAQVIRDEGMVEDALRQPLPRPFDAWLSDGIACFEANVYSSYKRLSRGAKGEADTLV